MTTPYTYLIGWTDHNKWYYGVRYADNCHPSELWLSYKTSSSAVSNFVAKHGDPQVIQVRKTFCSKDSARLWEHRVLRRLNVVRNEKWLNRTDNKSITPLYGNDHPNAKRRGKDSPFYGIKRPRIAELKQKEWTENNPMHTQSSKEKSIAKRSGENHHMQRAEVREKVSGKNNWIHKNPAALEERRQEFYRRNKANRGKVYRKEPCPYCKAEMPINNIKRHVSLCKNKDFS